MCLIERDCDITLGDAAGNLPMHVAARHDHVDCVRFLVKQGSLMEFTQQEGKMATHIVSMATLNSLSHYLPQEAPAHNSNKCTYRH